MNERDRKAFEAWYESLACGIPLWCTTQPDIYTLHAGDLSRAFQAALAHERSKGYAKAIVEKDRALRNCRALAVRKLKGVGEPSWNDIIRFCDEAGINESILRDSDWV